MEMRSYVDGILRKWWLVMLVVVLGWVVGGVIEKDLTSQYTATASVLINDKILTSAAFPSGVVQLTLPTSYDGELTAPALLNRIVKTYPYLSVKALQQNIFISTDATNQIMLIQVTDISSYAVADIANFLAQYFVNSQTTALKTQLEYYQQWLQPNVTRLNNEINNLNKQIDAITPAQGTGANILPPGQQKTLSEALAQRDQDARTLYDYQQALTEVQQALPLVPEVYVLLKPATIPDFAISSPPGITTIRLLSIAGGLLLVVCLCVAGDFFTPVIRHRGELPRIIGVSVLAEVPQLLKFEQKRLLQSQAIPQMERIKPLRLLCASLSAMAVKKEGHTVLLTAPRKKRHFAAVVAMFMAKKGHCTLLIEADCWHPSLHEQLRMIGPSNIQTETGRLLTFVNKTSHPNLFLLPASATSIQNQRFTEAALMEMLPELRSVFDLIIIDAPPFDTPVTHTFVTKVEQVLIYVKKRHDNLKELKEVQGVCQTLKLKPHYIFLT